MMDELKKMMGKKAKPEMDQTAIDAKLDVVRELLEMAQAAMAGKVKGGMDEMQKVSVMAPDTESLAEGLELAEDVVVGEEGEDVSDEMGEGSEVPEVEGMSALMAANDEPEEEENLFARKRMQSKRS